VAAIETRHCTHEPHRRAQQLQHTKQQRKAQLLSGAKKTRAGKNHITTGKEGTKCAFTVHAAQGWRKAPDPQQASVAARGCRSSYAALIPSRSYRAKQAKLFQLQEFL
jgi:hypothetical protein